MRIKVKMNMALKEIYSVKEETFIGIKCTAQLLLKNKSKAMLVAGHGGL
jgi:hypothetical protein